VVLIYDVGHVAVSFLQLIPQRFGEPDDVAGSSSATEIMVGIFEPVSPGRFEWASCVAGGRRCPTATAKTATAQPASASGCRSGGRAPSRRGRKRRPALAVRLPGEYPWT
jgi:hypothetical protein